MASKKIVKVSNDVVSNVAPMLNNVGVGVGMKVIFADVKVKGMSMQKQDKPLSNKVNSDNNAEKGTALVTVKKYPESFCKPITNAGQGVYQVYKNFGIVVGNHFAIPITNYPKFEQSLKEAISKFNLTVSTLRDAVQNGSLADIAKAQQGDLLNVSESLTVEDIDSTFGVFPKVWKNLNCDGIASAMSILGEDILSQVDESHAKHIAEVKEISEKAGAKRIAEEVSKVMKEAKESCAKADIKGVQWKTLIMHIQKAIDTLPNFNVTDNKVIDELLIEMKEKIGNVKEYELKNDEIKRKELATSADEIASKFANMFE